MREKKAGPNSRFQQLTKETIDRVDAEHDTPKERAEEIFTVFQLGAQDLDYEWTEYDIMCFCVQFLSMMSLGSLSTDEDLRILVKNLNRWLHERHYFHAEEILK